MLDSMVVANESMDRFIREKCFPFIHPNDVVTFARLLRRLPPEGEQWMHMLRELIYGSFLAENGLVVRYEREISGKTPDWSVVSPNGDLMGLLDVVNFHNAQRIERYIAENLALAPARMVGVWKDPPAIRQKLYTAFEDKFLAYKGLIECLEIPYVVGFFETFFAPLDLDDYRDALLNEEYGLLRMHPQVSGVLIGKEGPYRFWYVSNPWATIAFDLPSGTFREY